MATSSTVHVPILLLLLLPILLLMLLLLRDLTEEQGLEGTLVQPACFFHQEPSLLLHSCAFLLALTGSLAPAGWEQDWERLMRSHWGNGEHPSETAPLCFLMVGELSSRMGRTTERREQAAVQPVNSCLLLALSLQSSAQAAFYLAL